VIEDDSSRTSPEQAFGYCKGALREGIWMPKLLHWAATIIFHAQLSTRLGEDSFME